MQSLQKEVEQAIVNLRLVGHPVTLETVCASVQTSSPRIARIKRSVIIGSVRKVLARRKDEEQTDTGGGLSSRTRATDTTKSLLSESDASEESEERATEACNSMIQRLYGKSMMRCPPPVNLPEHRTEHHSRMETPEKLDNPEPHKPIRPRRPAADDRTNASKRQRPQNKTVKWENHAVEDFMDPQGSSGARTFMPEPPCQITFASFGGAGKVIQLVQDLVVRSLQHPELCHHFGCTPVRGILLHGPPGCGKTLLALAAAGEAGVPYFRIAGPEIVAGVSGQSESLLRRLFEAAKKASPSLIFIDELDALCPKRDSSSREMERRIVAQFCACMDDLGECSVVVLGATNRADALDPTVRRSGRFDREIAVGIPDDKGREEILKVLLKKMKLDASVDVRTLARMTSGFVGADLEMMTKEAALACLRRLHGRELPYQSCAYSEDQLRPHSITHDDFLEAVKRVQPSAKREGFATAPDVTWDMVGGLADQRKELEDQVCLPIRHCRLYHKLGLDVPAGILLFGPPGCGKTLLAKAVAKESGANFISIKGPELLNKYVGESERAIRQVFQRARMSAPCVIFFDELDSLCCRRGNDGSNAASERVVNQLLTEMDGVEGRRNVFVVAATNRPDLIDPAMLRPGRLDRLVWVPLPDKKKRIDILQRLQCKTKLAADVDLESVGSSTDGFSGADLAALLRRAMIFCLEERRSEVPHYDSCPELLQEDTFRIEMHHINKALASSTPSISQEQLNHYQRIHETMGRRHNEPAPDP